MSSEQRTARETLEQTLSILGELETELADRVNRAYSLVSAALRAAPAPSCAGCGGRGVVGGYEPVEYGTVFGNRAADIPCPDCCGAGDQR